MNPIYLRLKNNENNTIDWEAVGVKYAKRGIGKRATKEGRLKGCIQSIHLFRYIKIPLGNEAKKTQTKKFE